MRVEGPEWWKDIIHDNRKEVLHMPELSRRVQTFTDSVIRRMTRINNMTPGSINLTCCAR